MNIRAKINSYLSVMLLIIALFLMLPKNIDAAYFKYADFNWEEFSKDNASYWENYCSNSKDENCESDILKNQEKFYTKLYSLLAKYENKGYYIDDNIIIETVFIGLTPSTFSDVVDEYDKSWDSKSGAYNISDEDIDEETASENEISEFYEEEKDTLKTLINHMLSYQATCYGIYKDATLVTKEDGTSSYTCDVGYHEVIDGVDKCADKIKNYNVGFWETLTNNTFLGHIVKSEKKQECLDNKDYPEGTKFITSNTKAVNVSGYFEFLVDTPYFDNKAHLQYRFKDILTKENVDCLSNSVCDNSLESKDLYDEYEEDIKKIREEIVLDIKEILEEYGIDINSLENNDTTTQTPTQIQRKSYYWPIGSKKTETKGDYLYASKEPESTEVISYYGNRRINSEESMHYGIDLKGTNVIAIYNGEVIAVEDKCQDKEDICNDGYGKYIIISHPNGDYSLYANLDSIESNISVGTKVLRGMLLGTVGSSSNVEENCLHFEIRVGNNDSKSSIDPLTVLDINNPRPTISNYDHSTKETTLTKEEFISKVKSYCNTNTCADSLRNIFIPQLDTIYDYSVSIGVNPELVVIRAMVEGFSPGSSYNNYWGMGCGNTCAPACCITYSSLENGISGFASTVTRYDTIVEVMNAGYAFLGAYWYNPGDSSHGGCYYYPYIKKYMDEETAKRGEAACNGPACSGQNCTKTTAEDQKAYAIWQVEDKMNPTWRKMFGF